MEKRTLVSCALEAARKYKVPGDLFCGLIESESSFNPNAVGPQIESMDGVRALGIAQFLPETAKLFGIDPMNPFQSLDAAANYLAQLEKRYGDWQKAVAAYKGFKDLGCGRAWATYHDVKRRGQKYGGKAVSHRSGAPPNHRKPKA